MRRDEKPDHPWGRDSLIHLPPVEQFNLMPIPGLPKGLGWPQTSCDVEKVVLIDENGIEAGSAGKLEAHQEGLAHRAFSIFLVDGRGRLLLQRRSLGKYHSPGLWANSCCGHPRPGEPVDVAARRRLSEELGVQVDLTRAFQSRYRAAVGNGLVENEWVEVYFGRFPGSVSPNPEEVGETGLYSLEELTAWSATAPDELSVWLRHYLARHEPAIGDWIRKMTRGAVIPRD